MDKAFKEWNVSGTCKTDPTNGMRLMRVATTAFDALTWQVTYSELFTSVLVRRGILTKFLVIYSE